MSLLNERYFSDIGWDGDDHRIQPSDRKKWVTKVDRDRGVFYTPFYIKISKNGKASVDKKIVKKAINDLLGLL